MIKRLILIGLAFGLAACESTPMMQSGPDAEVTFDGLVAVDGTRMDDVWVKPGAALGAYDKVKLVGYGMTFKPARDVRTPSQIARADNFPLSDRQKEQLRAIVIEEFLTELRKSENYEIVSEDGPGVLVLEGMLMDVVSKIPPETPSRASYYLTELGSATLVLNLSDSVTGEPLARVVDRKTAENFRMEESNSVRNSSEVRRAMSQWAVSMREGLDMLHDVVVPER